MKQKEKNVMQNLCVLIGICLLAAALVMTLLWQWNTRVSRQQSQAYADTLRSLIPGPQSAVPEERRDNTMPVLSLEGEDFIGILEFPRYDSVLPVGAEWGRSASYPCCLDGSIYDKTIQIGGTSQTGQYDFFRRISAGDQIYFTDVEGNRYAFTVSDLRYEKHADRQALQSREAALTLFIKNIYAFEYLIVFCDIPH